MNCLTPTDDVALDPEPGLVLLQWPPELREVQVMLEKMIGRSFNSVMCSLYRDGKDNVSWHSDDEEIFGRNPTVASVSLGDTRMLELRKKSEPVSEYNTSYLCSDGRERGWEGMRESGWRE